MRTDRCENGCHQVLDSCERRITALTHELLKMERLKDQVVEQLVHRDILTSPPKIIKIGQSKLLSLYKRKAEIADELAGFYEVEYNYRKNHTTILAGFARQKQKELIEIDKQIRELEK